MAGHSHWAGIKHKKALIDNKRGKVWSKISKALMVAARLGGGDPAYSGIPVNRGGFFIPE